MESTKSKWMRTIVMFISALLIATAILISGLCQRYSFQPREGEVIMFDKLTGTLYFNDSEKNRLVKGNIIESANKK